MFDSYLYLGQLWRPDLSLLGAVWWPRWFWGSCSGLPPPPSPHRPAPSGGDGDPLYTEPAGPNLPGWGAYQSPSHPDIPTCPHQGCIAPRGRGCSGLTQHPTHTFLYWEEDFAREPGDRSHRECFQRHGKEILKLLIERADFLANKVSDKLPSVWWKDFHCLMCAFTIIHTIYYTEYKKHLYSVLPVVLCFVLVFNCAPKADTIFSAQLIRT